MRASSLEHIVHSFRDDAAVQQSTRTGSPPQLTRSIVRDRTNEREEVTKEFAQRKKQSKEVRAQYAQDSSRHSYHVCLSHFQEKPLFLPLINAVNFRCGAPCSKLSTLLIQGIIFHPRYRRRNSQDGGLSATARAEPSAPAALLGNVGDLDVHGGMVAIHILRPLPRIPRIKQ
jgi:hypothetical protein